MKKYIINTNDSGQRVDKFVLKVAKNLPKSLLYKSLRLKKIKLNRKRCQGNEILSVGDVLELYINDEFFVSEDEAKELEFLNSKRKLKTVFEDENIIVMEKEAGLICHSGNENSSENLVSMMQKYLFEKGEFNPKIESSFSPSLCNRIDRNTSGLVIGAKNAMALREINRKISENKLTKLYLTLVFGKMEKEEGEIICYIKKPQNQQTVLVSKAEKDGFKKAITKFKVLDYDSERDISLLEINLITGRTHQIRASLDFFGHSLVGEKKYIKNKPKKIIFKEPKFQALSAFKIRFLKEEKENPLSYLEGKEISLEAKEVLDNFGIN